ncbi:MAG: hypothetical protein KKA19_01720, partial [Candidatus Margulisbacteria bacterium]|nr:hypothetical protein [Candidatus Margulisiibacteriota bacterium]
NIFYEKQIQGNKFYILNSSPLGIVVGHTPFQIANQESINFVMKSATDYAGLYSSLFLVKDLSELELAANFQNTLTKIGQPADWACPTIEIIYYAANGDIVYPAEYGEERYPKIAADPNTNKAIIKKSFFIPPIDRGAVYGQVKVHFVRQWDENTDQMDINNYYSGQASIANLQIRPALSEKNLNHTQIAMETNWAPNNGTFYKHINGQALNWETNRLKVVEDLKKSQRSITFENKDSSWSSLITNLEIPPKAQGLVGEINIAIENDASGWGIKAGLQQWEGFGLFLEAEAEDTQGHLFQFGGIPVFQKKGDVYLPLHRIVMPYQGRLQFFIPLQYQNLKIKKLKWQLALAGYGKVKLLPLDNTPNAPLIKLNLLTSAQLPATPIFWSQYALDKSYSDSQGNVFSFQPKFELSLTLKEKITAAYENAETLADHLIAYLKNNQPQDFDHEFLYNTLVAKLKNVSLEKPFDLKSFIKDSIKQDLSLKEATIQIWPSYAHVSQEIPIQKNYPYCLIEFTFQGTPQNQAEYSFRPQLLNANGDALDLPYLKRNYNKKNTWFIPDIAGDQTSGKKAFLIPLNFYTKASINKYFGTPKKLRVVLGNNKGYVDIQSLRITYLSSLGNNILRLQNAGVKTLIRNSYKGKSTLLKEKESLTLTFKNSKTLLSAKTPHELSFKKMPQTASRQFNNQDFAQLSTQEPIIEPIRIKDFSKISEKDMQIRNSIKNKKVFYQEGKWYFAPNYIFIPAGFTIVGETFNYWFNLRKAEFKNFKTNPPYWLKFLSSEENQALKEVHSEKEFIKYYARAMANLWASRGYNMLRVHQLFAVWSGLNREDINLVVAILKIWQEEKGFLIDFDLLPNPNFIGPFFSKDLNNKKWAKDLSNLTDLFKATLVLPEIREEYVKPALKDIFNVFIENNFWPNALSYCNETGFTHGFWLIDANNSEKHAYFSNQYYLYYDRFKKFLAQNTSEAKTIKEFINSSYALFQTHVQIVKAKKLAQNLSNIIDLLASKKNLRTIGLYGTYNLLGEDIIAQFPEFSTELYTLRQGTKKTWPPENGLGWFAEAKVNLDYYQELSAQLAFLKQALQKLENSINKKQQSVSSQLLLLVQDPLLTKALKVAQEYILTWKAGGQTPENIYFAYIDSFDSFSPDQQAQSFFTSFLLTTSFCKNINDFIRTQAPAQVNYVVGMNNDYIKDPFELISRIYLYSNGKMEWRFNKYVHHPMGGHAMNRHAGQGNIFAEDSDINYNIELFHPLLSNNVPMRLTETNYTYVGDNSSGEGCWTNFAYLYELSRGNSILGFQHSLNNIEQNTLRDYFNFGNNPFKLSGFNLVAYQSLKQQNINIEFNPFSQQIIANSNDFSGLGQLIGKGETIIHPQHGWKFNYNGDLGPTPITIMVNNLDSKNILVSFYGIERNTNQKNRPGNANLIQTFGTAPILYQNFPGIFIIPLESSFSKRNIVLKGISPTNPDGQVISSKYYEIISSGNKRYLKIYTYKLSKDFYSYKISHI